MTNYLHLLWFCVLLLQLCSTAGVESCKVEELSPSSSYVSASFKLSVSVTGCTSKELSLSAQSVYVVGLANWSSAISQTLVIDLHLQNTTSHGESEKRIFVLASELPVIWRLHLDAKYRVFNGMFVMSNQSQLSHSIRLKYKEKHADVPLKGDAWSLENWVRQKWGAVTMLAYLQQPANWITLPLASVPGGNATCHIQPNFSKIQAGNVEEQTIRGCIERVTEKSHERDVHIVELSSASFNLHRSPLPVVELNIKSKIRKQLVVILKCHHPVKWKILTPQLKGTVDFITDQPIDSSGIKARHFHVSAERLHMLTGQDLISWSAEKYGPLTSYSSVNFANSIVLTVDVKDSFHNKAATHGTASAPIEMAALGGNGDHMSLADNKKRLKRLIIRSLSLSCKENSMRISILKYPLRNFLLSFGNISFLDVSCQAVDAGVQILLSTRYSECGTLHPITRDGTSIFTNAIVVQPQISVLPVSNHDLSPELPLDMKMPVIINVSCHYLKPRKCSSGAQNCDFDNHFDESQIVTRLIKGPFMLLPTEDTEPAIAALQSHDAKETFLPVTLHQDSEQPVMMERVQSACTGVVLIDGVATGAVIGISFAAFFIGVLLMSSLWYIHVCTGPRKKIGLKASDSSNITSKLFCSNNRA